MRNITILLFALVMASATSFAQEPYACVAKGAVLVYANYDEKGKVDNYDRLTIQDVSQNGDNYTITTYHETLDKIKDKQGYNEMLTKSDIVDGGVQVDAGGIGVQVISADQNALRIPNKLTVGYKLPIGDMAVSMEGVQVVCTISDNEVINREEITTDAGTFKCYVIRQTSTIAMFAMGVTTVSTTWYCRGVGIVKSESMVGNKIVGRRELVSFTK